MSKTAETAETAETAAVQETPEATPPQDNPDAEDAIAADAASAEDRAVMEDLAASLVYMERRARDQGVSLTAVLIEAAKTGLGVDLR